MTPESRETGAPEPSAPERVWRTRWGTFRTTPFSGDVEYIRADAAEALIREKVAAQLDKLAEEEKTATGDKWDAGYYYGIVGAAAFVREGRAAK